MGLGVVLGSLPLCEADIESEQLVRLSKDCLSHRETYWIIADKKAVSFQQWAKIVELIF